jgi:NAD+ synthetase
MITIKDLQGFVKVKRNFIAKNILKLKLKAINDFFKKEKLDSVVLGLSGGLDSSMVLKLFIEASKQPNSTLKKILGVFMPINSDGISGQNEAEEFIKELNMSIDYNRPYDYIKQDLTNVVNLMHKQMNPLNQWVAGQYACIMRTPVLYGYAAQLQAQGFKSIVLGTTNMDEGSYIGFYGKASDGMNDLQSISDLHKSEVAEIAKLLNVPQSIINRKPVGDVWDKKCDEEMIGCPYWFLELYTELLSMNSVNLLYDIQNESEVELWVKSIQKLRQQNIHKYQVGLPSKNIDVMENIKHKFSTLN